MASWDGKQNVQLTYSDDSEHTPRWSPDGKYIGFLTARGENDPPEQVWLLDRQGGEAKPLTGFNGDVTDFSWSPDGKKLALIVSDEDPRKQLGADKDKTPPPIVIDRYYFKEDGTGYLGTQRQHLYLFDVATRKAENLTPGRFDESMPSWSPDGSRIAFVSNRNEDPDRNNEFGLYTIEPRTGATPKLLTKFQGDAGDSSWMSPADVVGPMAARSLSSPRASPSSFSIRRTTLAVVPATGGTGRILGKELDRNVIEPRWSADGRSIYFLLEDDRNQVLARIAVASGKVERVLDGRRESLDYDLGGKGRIALLDSTVDSPDAVYALEGKQLRALSHHNDEWLASVKLGDDRRDFFLIQRRHTHQWLCGEAAQLRRRKTLSDAALDPWRAGLAVCELIHDCRGRSWRRKGTWLSAANPRGSSGRGEAFATAIYRGLGRQGFRRCAGGGRSRRSTGHRRSESPRRRRLELRRHSHQCRDRQGHALQIGDQRRLDFEHASRVMARTCTSANMNWNWACRGRTSTSTCTTRIAFLHADRIKTPTLFLCGEQDFNVPLLNSEQMYQALRSLGVPTQLVIYPGEHHGLRKPSYLKDRMQRYLDWHGKYLNNSPRPAAEMTSWRATFLSRCLRTATSFSARRYLSTAARRSSLAAPWRRRPSIRSSSRVVRTICSPCTSSRMPTAAAAG